jgi:hypothetical protein
VTPYLIFVRGMMFPGRHTINERTGTRRRPREWVPCCSARLVNEGKGLLTTKGVQQTVWYSFSLSY